MSIAFDAVSTGTDKDNNLTVEHAASGSDRVAVVVVAGIRNNDSAWTFADVTYDSVSMTFQDGWGVSPSASRYMRVEIWTLLDPPTGAKDVVSDAAPAALLSHSLAVTTYTGVDAIGAANATGSTTGTAVSVGVTTTEDNAMLVGGVAGFEQVGGGSPGSGVTERWDYDVAGDYTNDDHRALGGHKSVASAGAETFDYTISTSNDWGVTVVELQPAGVTIAVGVGALAQSGPQMTVDAPTGPTVSLGVGTLAQSGPQASIVPGAMALEVGVGTLSLDSPAAEPFAPSHSTPTNLAATAVSETRADLVWEWEE